MSLRHFVLASAALAAVASAPLAAKNPMVGGAAMYPTRTIVANAVNSKDHTTLVAAVKAAGLVDTLSGKGPFTVFAPTNAAFARLPAGTVETLVKPENKATLTSILTYHVVPGRITVGPDHQPRRAQQGHRDAQDRPGRDAPLPQERPQLGRDGQQGRHGDDHHRQRDAVQRRHSRHRPRVDAVTGIGWRLRSPRSPAGTLC